VALAVARDDGETVTREVETGSSEREANMVAFAVEGLKLVRDVIKGGGSCDVLGGCLGPLRE
jgi:hypothetical protein